MNNFEQKLTAVAGQGAVKTEEPMKKHTTFRIGGPAQYYVTPADGEAVAAVVGLCKTEGVPYYVIGNGSNLLVSDEGWRGVILSTERLCRCQVQGNRVRAGAGVLLSRMAKAAREQSLTGFEFAAGIPGTLGGALVMNAGAYGSEMKDVLVSAMVLAPDGTIHRKAAEELELGYRTSCIPREGYVVLEAEVELAPGDGDAIQARMDDLAYQRKSKQPLEYPSAGSTFKRPAGYFAGKLIDDAGLRGFQVGGAQVSQKHCGFVINKDQATAQDVMELCQAVKDKVMECFGVELEMEVRRLGL